MRLIVTCDDRLRVFMYAAMCNGEILIAHTRRSILTDRDRLSEGHKASSDWRTSRTEPTSQISIIAASTLFEIIAVFFLFLPNVFYLTFASYDIEFLFHFDFFA